MKFNIRPGILICMSGFTGLIFILIDNTDEIGSKIPLSIFFIIIMIIGLAIELAPRDKIDGIFGEVEGKEFG